MQQQYPFQPRGAVGTTPNTQVNIAVTSAVQQVNLPVLPSEGVSMRVVVDGTQGIAWSYGSSSGLTVGNGVYMLPNTVEVFNLPPSVTQLSVIAAASGSTLRVILGDGQ